MKDPQQTEKIGLLALAGLCVVGLTIIALDAIHGRIDASGAAILGSIAAALGAFGKDIVAAIRGYSMSAQLGKVTDQLASSRPDPNSAPSPSPAPAPGASEAARQTADAADLAASEIEEQSR